MNPTSLMMALAPAFAAGFAIQRLLEILDPLAERFAGPERKKIVLGLSSLVAGLGVASVVGVRVLAHLGVSASNGSDLLDLMITALVISAGTDGFNSILKFMNYKKEEQKEEAKMQSLTTLSSKALFESKTSLIGALTTACDYTRTQIEQLVVGVYRQILDDDSITRFSRFGPGNEIDIDSEARRAFFFPIKQNVDRIPNCVITKLTIGDVQTAKTVGEIVDAICEEFKIA